MQAPRILVVEDERIVALSLCEKLTALGYRPAKPVASGKAALQAIEDERPDLILMDINLEGPLDGVETVARIPGGLPNTGHIPYHYSEDAIVKRASATNPSGYLLSRSLGSRIACDVTYHSGAASRGDGLSRGRGTHARRAENGDHRPTHAGGVAHDFNNSLMDHSRQTGGTGRTYADQPEQTELIRTVFQSAMRCEKLTGQLLSFSQRQPHSPIHISLADFISGMTSGFLHTLGEATQIQSLVPPVLWRIKADPDELERALLNLVEKRTRGYAEQRRDGFSW